MTSRPALHAAVVACGAVAGAGVAGGVSAFMGGPFAWSALLVVVTAVPAMLPTLLGGQTVPSRYGAIALFAMTGQMFLTLGAAMFVRVAGDVPMKPFLGGVAAGAGVLLTAQVAIAVWTLNRATPAVDGEGDTDA